MGKENTEKALADETDKLVREIIGRGVDCVIGGFPCQDISTAAFAHTAAPGVRGSRSGLFWEAINTFRLVGAKYLLLENVAALFNRNRTSDMGEILGCLASIGNDAEWDCISAGAIGAPHHRARAYILAHDRGFGWRRFFPFTIHREREFDAWKDVRRVEDIPDMPALYPSKLCRGNNGVTKRLHAIGNGNPPGVIRQIMKGLSA